MKRTLVIVVWASSAAPTRRRAPCGFPIDFICSGEMNSPGIKVLTRASKRLDALTRGRAANKARSD